MYLNLSPQTIGVSSTSTDTLIQQGAQHGFGGIDIPDSALDSKADAEHFRDAIAAAGLKPGLFSLPCDISSARDSAFNECLEELDRMAPLVKMIGGTRTYNHIWPGSQQNNHRDNLVRHEKRIKAVAKILAGHQIQIGLEFLGPKTLRDTFTFKFIYTLEDLLTMAGRCGDNVGLVFDFFHLYTSGGTLSQLKGAVKADMIVNVHANDAVAGVLPDAQQDLKRAMPGTMGVINSKAAFAWLREIGYAGPVIVEPFNPALDRFTAMESEEVLAEVAACVLPLMNG